MLRVPTLALTIALAAGLGACREAGLPDSSTEAYREAVGAFYAGLAGIQTGAHRPAEEYLTQVTELAPEEPAAWANLGLLALRENRFDEAAERLERARALAPDNGRILFLSGLLEQSRGRSEAAIAYLRRAVEREPADLKAAYALAQELERQGEAGSITQVTRLLDRMLGTQPDNLVLLLEQARMAAIRSDTAALRTVAGDLAARAPIWPADMRKRVGTLENAAARADFREAAEQVALLKNELARLPVYRVHLAAVQNAPGQDGVLITEFLRLPRPHMEPAAADTALTFTADSLSIDGGPWDWVRALPLSGNRVLTLAVANGRTVKLGTGATFPFPGGSSATSPTRDGIVAVDYDNDYLVDVVLAGAGGMRLVRQESEHVFTDVTEHLGLPDDIRRAAYTRVWAADLDLEGDLDLVLAAEVGPPRVLRNNGDGTFSVWPILGGADGLRGFAWADLDADGDPDAALVDAAGRLHVFSNERAGHFQPFEGLPTVGTVRAVDAADLDTDSRMELLTFRADGIVQRISAAELGDGWELTTVARWTDRRDSILTASLFVADLDNNGGLDLVAATPGDGRVWLSGVEGRLQPLHAAARPRIFDVADLSGTGRLDLISLSEDGQPVHHTNRGEKNYSSKSIQLRAARTTGDQRINSFGIGGTVEVRSGLLYQKQRISGPVLHFGLGEHELVDVARIIWPNGTMQAEFGLETDQTVLAQQRLKGSCPWVFTHDGQDMRFVTDFLWRTALGLRINAQGGTGVIHSEDWVKIDGEAMKARRDGLYDVRITAELWETHFFDHVALMTVDHPVETEVFVDERFALPPPELALHSTAPPRSVEEARDSRGRDVTDLVRRLDGRYLDTFELGPYQGLAEEHHVEMTLGDDAPASGPLWLVASGWVRPTDSSINLAISQGGRDAPRGLLLEIPDGSGGWTTVRSDLGFPAGKTKTVLIDLEGVFRPGAPRRVRLRTSMEIYWDRLAWAAGRPDAEIRSRRLVPKTAELRYRGFSAVSQANHASPELPDYGTLAATAPQWRDLIGYHTRFGDVRPLVESTDDRYVIMNAGDELGLRFAVPPPPPEGWVRDFVLIGDGWVKDGDFNTGFSKTVRPLPYHGLTDYSKPPGRLEDDPAYRRHPLDWQTYHTRYITPDPFQHALTTTPSRHEE